MTEPYKFGPFTLDAAELRLLKDGVDVAMQRRAFDVLVHLVENAGAVVDKQDALDAVWGDTVVTENSLSRCIVQIRTALEDDADNPLYIQTVPGVGYRFVGSLELESEPNKVRLTGIGAAAVLVVVIGVFLWWLPRDEPADRTIAVLPFASWSEAVEDQSLTMGITAEVRSALAKLDGLVVSARASSRAAGDDAVEAAKLLGARYVLQGSLQRQGRELKVNVTLTDAGADALVWSGSFRQGLDDPFLLEREVANGVATSLVREIESPDSVPEANSEAYVLFLIGREQQYRRGRGWYDSAIEAYSRAIELDPELGVAYAGRAIARILSPEGRADQPDVVERAREDVAHGMRLAPDNAVVLTAASRLAEGREERMEFLERALAIDPDVLHGKEWYVTGLGGQGRMREARELRHELLERDPLNPLAHHNVGVGLMNVGVYVPAKEHLIRGFDLPDQSFGGTIAQLVILERMFGEYAKALAWFEHGSTLTTDVPAAAHAGRLKILAMLGYFQEARVELEMAGEKTGRYVDDREITLRAGSAEDLRSTLAALVEHGLPLTPPLALDQVVGEIHLQLGEPAAAVHRLAPTFEGFAGVPYERSHFRDQVSAMQSLAAGYQALGEQELAEVALAKVDDYLAHIQQEGVVAPYVWERLARQAAIRKDAEQAASHLQNAVRRGWGDYFAVLHDVRWSAVRDDPAFQTAMAELRARVDDQRQLYESRRNNGTLTFDFAIAR